MQEELEYKHVNKDMGEKCFTCQIAELIVQGTFLCVIAFLSFNVACDIQSIRRNVQCISEEVRERQRQIIRDRVTKEGEEYMSDLSDGQNISATIKNDGQKDDNE